MSRQIPDVNLEERMADSEGFEFSSGVEEEEEDWEKERLEKEDIT